MISVPLALLLPITRLLYNLFHLFLVIMYDLCVLLYYLFIRNPFVCLIFTNLVLQLPHNADILYKKQCAFNLLMEDLS